MRHAASSVSRLRLSGLGLAIGAVVLGFACGGGADSPEAPPRTPAWETVGSALFSAGSADFLTIKIDPSGTPYVAYTDGANGNKATVMRFR
jgi:hypothetical protein